MVFCKLIIYIVVAKSLSVLTVIKLAILSAGTTNPLLLLFFFLQATQAQGKEWTRNGTTEGTGQWVFRNSRAEIIALSETHKLWSFGFHLNEYLNGTDLHLNCTQIIIILCKLFAAWIHPRGRTHVHNSIAS